MAVRKEGVTKQDLQNFEEKIIHQFHIVSEGITSQVKQVAEGVVNLNEKLDRNHHTLTEIQETRQEVLAAIKFSYAELDRRLSTIEKEFLELKHRVDKIEDRSIS
jgi:DNA repair exonuclease SbcCD ATPase subunit